MNKRYLWVVEIWWVNNKWKPMGTAFWDRAAARRWAQMHRDIGDIARIRKYIPEEE